MVKYRVRAMWRQVEPEIKRFECERETEASVWINGDRHPKTSADTKYFDDFETAKKYAILRQTTFADDQARSATKSLEVLEKITSLTDREGVV